ncbi:MAG: hypothetical protein IKP62_06355 [Salinivirgaceae bacterium]|nr:hypothetical protein [Salinivirgaceae bacterium]
MGKGKKILVSAFGLAKRRQFEQTNIKLRESTSAENELSADYCSDFQNDNKNIRQTHHFNRFVCGCEIKNHTFAADKNV